LLAGEALDDETVIGADRFKLTFGASPYEMPPAVAFARPAVLLHAYRALVESDRGRRHVDRVQRWLRGGRRERTARASEPGCGGAGRDRTSDRGIMSPLL